MTGDDPTWRKSWFYAYFLEDPKSTNVPDITAARTTNAKLIRYPDHKAWTESFDLKSDPYEIRNLIDDPTAADFKTEMLAKFTLMPNRKTDPNSDSGISNNSIGANYGNDWNWATLNHDERIALAKKHELWQRGLLWTIQNHPRVPENIRKEYSKWGLPKDEFADNNNWPHELYVREARRRVSDFVMTEKQITGKEPATESIGLAAYTMDSHAVQRFVDNGMVKNEGDVQIGIPGPYPVSYRAIVPIKSECENLLVPWSLSASHMAFGSIRMEPVFMILSQSAATAANIAIERGVSVQHVPYADLGKQLLKDKQRLAR